MISSKSTPKKGETTWLWLIKIITGLLIVIILGIHFVVNHFIGENALLTYADVIAYYSNPIVPIMEIAFLFMVVGHSLIGLRGVILDLNPSRRTLTIVDWLFSAVGIVAVGYSTWLILELASRANGG